MFIGGGAGLDRLQTTHDPLRGVIVHIAIQQLLFRTLGQHFRVVVSDVARELKGLGCRQLVTRLVVHPISQLQAQLVFGNASCPGQRENDLGAFFQADLDYRLGFTRTGRQTRCPVRGQAGLDTLRDYAAGRGVDIQAGKRDAVVAAQLETAAGSEKRRDGRKKKSSVHGTILTKRPGTTTTFFGGLPSRYFCAASLATAAASTAALSAAAATRICPRNLPLTSSINSISSCTRADSSTAGQVMTAPGLSSACRASQTCGTMGASRATAASSTS